MKEPVRNAQWLRARMIVIDTLFSRYNEVLSDLDLKEEPGKEYDKIKKQIQNGYLENAATAIGEGELNQIWKDAMQEAGEVKGPLSFTETIRYSTYFKQNPDRIAGEEIETTSRQFPITIKGKVNEIRQMFNRVFNPKIDEMKLNEIRAKAQEIHRRLKARLNGEPKSSSFELSGLNGLEGLGELAPGSRQAAENNLVNIEKALEKSGKEQSEKDKKVLSFDETVKTYNAGISKEEIQAWVWYKRTLGVPMTGWEDYFLSGTGDKTVTLISKTNAVIFDQVYRELRTVPPGKVLGKYTGKFHEYKEDVYLIYRSEEGLHFCIESQVRKVTNDTGYASTAEIERLVKAGALFFLNGEYLPFPVYAYGNMYDRILQLQSDQQEIIARFGEAVYNSHKEVIKNAKPRLLSIVNPDPAERPKILSISEFASEFVVDQLRDEFNKEFPEPTSLREAFKSYLTTLGPEDFKVSDFGNITKHYLDGKKVMDKKLSPEQRSELKANARNEGEELFSRFLFEGLNFEDQQKLDIHWNRLYNGQASLAYHRIPVGFEASARFKNFKLELRPAQREGIAFVNAVGSGIIAYDVGVGKTLTAIVTIADAIYAGKAVRPLIVVPNPTYKKWIDEIIGYTDRTGKFVPGILSHTGISVNEWYNLGKDVVGDIDLDRAVPKGSITVVTYEGLKKIGFSRKVMNEMIVELSNILGQSSRGISQRDAEVEYLKYEQMIGVGIRDTVADIDTLGFDMIVIDEAHRCKNIFDGIKKDDDGNKRFSIQGAVSDTGIKAFFLCNFIQRRFGRNVILLTATPFTNSPLEIYSMLSLVAYDAMKSMGIQNITHFFELFVLESTEYVVNMKEELVPKNVIKRFNNRLILQKLIYNHITYKTGEEAGIIRPCKINLPRVNEVQDGRIVRLTPDQQILTYLRMTPEQRDNQHEITDLVRRAESGRFNQALMFQALNHSLNNALSPFLYSGESPADHIDFVENSPKIHYTMECIRSVKQWHESRMEPVSGQVIYMNRGKNYFGFIKDYLEQEIGYKQDLKWGRMRMDEVEIITSDVSPSRKESIKEAFLEGVVKVIIGTATIREGIDLQRNSTVLYNLYPDWNPTDIRQLEGRIWRQGNRFGFVRVVMPLVQDSMDTFVFQKLEEKTSRINDIWYKGDRGNVLDLESLDPEEIKFALMTDVNALADHQIKKDLAEAERAKKRIEYQVSVLATITTDIQRYLDNQASVVGSIDRFYAEAKESKIVKDRPDKAALEKMTPEEKRRVTKTLKVWDDLVAFKELAPREDKDILKIVRTLKNYLPSISINGERDYKEYLSKVKKAEKTILKDKGYTLDSDISAVKNQLEMEYKIAEELVEKIKSEEYKWKVFQEVEYKKSTLAIDGKTVEERATEFSRFNYLMSFRQGDLAPNTCIIPRPEQARPGFDIDLVRVKMKLLALRLRLRTRQSA